MNILRSIISLSVNSTLTHFQSRCCIHKNDEHVFILKWIPTSFIYSNLCNVILIIVSMVIFCTFGCYSFGYKASAVYVVILSIIPFEHLLSIHTASFLASFSNARFVCCFVMFISFIQFYIIFQ